MGLAEERPDAAGGFAFAICKDHKGIGKLPLPIFLLTIIDPGEKGPCHGCDIPLRRSDQAVNRQKGLLPLRIFHPDIRMGIVEERPQDKHPVVPGDLLRLVPDIRPDGHILVLGAVKGPDLPSVQSIPVAGVVEGVEIVVRHDILLAGLNVERKHHEGDLIPHQPVLEMPVEGQDRRVVFVGVGGPLLKIEGEDREPIPVRLRLAGPSREAEQLEELPPVLPAVAIVGEERVGKILFQGFQLRISHAGEQGRQSPSLLAAFLFVIIKRPCSFRAGSLRQGQAEAVPAKAERLPVFCAGMEQ